MTYSFDAIKNNWRLLFFTVLAPSVFMVLLILFHTKGIGAYLPQIFVRSIKIPVLASIIVAIIIIWSKKMLFWTRMNLHIDEDNLTLNINGKSFKFNDLEHYEYRLGSLLTTGGSPVLFVKFKGAKKIMIMPCKSAPDSGNYEHFRARFNQVIESLSLEKRKKHLSKISRTALYVICVLIPVVFIGFWLDKGASAAFKLFPGFVFLGLICGIYLHQDLKK